MLSVCTQDSFSQTLAHIYLGFVKKEESGAQSRALPAFALKTFIQSSAKDCEIFCSSSISIPVEKQGLNVLFQAF